MEEEKVDLLDDKNSQGIAYFDNNPFSTSIQPNDGQRDIAIPLIEAAIPNDHFILATFVTVCCCWPIGIFALWKSREVYRCASRGDARGARRASNAARTISWTTFIFGLLLLILICVLLIINSHRLKHA
ncbi:proline-rich transmembrane protein 1-like [Glandiceps talaboti]